MMQVYVEPLGRGDLLFITEAMYPQIPHDVIQTMVDFNQQVRYIESDIKYKPYVWFKLWHYFVTDFLY